MKILGTGRIKRRAAKVWGEDRAVNGERDGTEQLVVDRWKDGV